MTVARLTHGTMGQWMVTPVTFLVTAVSGGAVTAMWEPKAPQAHQHLWYNLVETQRSDAYPKQAPEATRGSVSP